MSKYTQYRKIRKVLLPIIDTIPISYGTRRHSGQNEIRRMLIHTYQALQNADNDKFFKKK